MRLLLDTHVALWWLNNPAELHESARDAIADGANEVAVSAASVWEVAIKATAGRLDIPTPFLAALKKAELAELPITWAHSHRVARLPGHHRDPFDRILIAQALEDGLVLVTRDPAIREYRVATLAA